MNISNVTTGKQVAAIMDRLDPMTKERPLFLQALEIDGKEDLVARYFDWFEKEYDEE